MPKNSKKTANPVPEHLKASCFKPGHTGNPNGRPKGSFSFENLIRNQLLKIRKEGGGKTRAQEVVESVIDAAIGGDMRAADMLMDRIDGKVASKIDFGDSALKMLTKLPESELKRIDSEIIDVDVIEDSSDVIDGD